MAGNVPQIVTHTHTMTTAYRSRTKANKPTTKYHEKFMLFILFSVPFYQPPFHSFSHSIVRSLSLSLSVGRIHKLKEWQAFKMDSHS